MKKGVLLFTFLICFFLASRMTVSADYVLPYPSVMPGSKLYQLHVLWDKAMRYWYFGDFGQFTYNLKESDKYLVEAKTLFEYQQYALGANALKQSNSYFTRIPMTLTHARDHGKSILEDQEILLTASQKHQQVLLQLETETPADVAWQPEKSTVSDIPIRMLLEQAILVRQHI